MSSFLNIDALATSNNWAGAKHWKWGANRIKTRGNTAVTSSDTTPTSDEAIDGSNRTLIVDENGEEVVALQPTKKSRTKKTKAASSFVLDFSACLQSEAWPDESLFAAPKKGSATMMTGEC